MTKKRRNNNQESKKEGQVGGKVRPIAPPSPSELDLEIPDGWLEIGTIVAPQGLDGELRVNSSTDFPERFEVPGMRWLLCPGMKEPREIELLSGRFLEGKRNLYIVELEGVEDRDEAEGLRGCKLLVRESDRPQELGEDEYHIMDLVGLKVFLQESGELVGTVVDLMSAGHDLLEVKPHSSNKREKTILIPFVREIVPVVDLEAGKVEITPPDGLLEINS